MSAKPFKVTNARSLVEEVLTLDYFHPDDEHKTPAIYSHFVPGKGPLVVVVGENASGKSFFRRLANEICSSLKIEFMPISAEGRRAISYSPWLAMVYGDEGHMSSGYNSISTVTVGINTCLGRDTKHVVFWDEPDLGLSDNGAAGMGVVLRDFVPKTNQHTIASIVVTHSKALLSQLVGTNHHLLVFGKTRVDSLQEWIDLPVVPRDPENIKTEGLTRFRRISKMIKAHKDARAKDPA